MRWYEARQKTRSARHFLHETYIGVQRGTQTTLCPFEGVTQEDPEVKHYVLEHSNTTQPRILHQGLGLDGDPAKPTRIPTNPGTGGHAAHRRRPLKGEHTDAAINLLRKS
ncbi:hypothetical protein NDU88_012518 [Pleurodeles waltl]|uniref:Uncharacterized protein n=1 Tax=Pleurodeles waltl TaxID=8319 RepID=A0AAV7R660_PLEWA|nr:hypothetical protein NDU88_012518 [Pleurodeles waltl]